MTRAAPQWLVPVAAILILQTTSAFLLRFIPIISPALSKEYGWSGSSIGYLTATNSFAGLVVMLLGSGLLRQIGGMRSIQISLLIGAASMALFFSPSLGLALLACFLMGLGNGAAMPAGSEVLQRFSPPEKRNLVFSIKQAGVPLGGVVAGLVVPPIVLLYDWRTAIFVSAILVVGTTWMTRRMSAGIDQRPTQRKIFAIPQINTLRKLADPFRSLTMGPGLLKMSIVGSLFVVAQSCWFTFIVIYLIERMDFSLREAGFVFAIMQTGGVVGRIALGWIADHARSTTTTLTITAIVSAITTLLLALSEHDWPLWSFILLAFIAGCSVSSWNGIQVAEIARRSPPDLITETASGSSILINVINMLVPALFAAFVSISGHYDYAFGAAAVCSLLAIIFLPRNENQKSAQTIAGSNQL